MNDEDIQKEFDQALAELKHVNDELFFDELKQKLDYNLLKYKSSYDENVQSIKGMEAVIKRLPMQFQADREKFSGEIMNISMEKLQQTSMGISQLYEEQINQYTQGLNEGIGDLNNIGISYSKLYDAFNSGFSSFVEEHNNLLKAQSQWLMDAKTALEYHRQELGEDIRKQIDKQLDKQEKFFEEQLQQHRVSTDRKIRILQWIGLGILILQAATIIYMFLK